MVESRLQPERPNTIKMWGGYISQIPSGWGLCDGQGGRPDMKNMFVKGVGTGEEPGVVGGSLTHTHGVQPLSTDQASASIKRGTAVAEAVGSHPHTITIPVANHEPPFYKVAFIIKL